MGLAVGLCMHVCLSVPTYVDVYEWGGEVLKGSLSATSSSVETVVPLPEGDKFLL